MCSIITTTDPNIFLIGIFETRLYGIGEKDEKLCIYEKSLFDIGKWEEFLVIDINVMKTECCKNGLHVAAGVNLNTIWDVHLVTIWIAVRDNELTRIFSIDAGTKELIQYIMSEDTEFEVPDLNLCCKCVAPIVRFYDCRPGLLSLYIVPQRFKKNVGIFRISIGIDKFQNCRLIKDFNPFSITQRRQPASSNILVNSNGQALSVYEKSEEGDKKIKKLLIQFPNLGDFRDLPQYDDSSWHEITFSTFDDFCLTLQKFDGYVNLVLHYTKFSITAGGSEISFCNFFNRTYGTNFPSLESTHFYVSYRVIEDGLKAKFPPSAVFPHQNLIPSFVVFQTPQGIIRIPFRVLSLSETAYLKLTEIPQPPPIQSTEINHSLFQSFLNLFQQKKPQKAKVDDEWMSLSFIKKTMGLPKDFDLR